MNPPRCSLMQQHRVRAQTSFGVRKAPGSLARTPSPYPQEHRSQMHFLFVGAIGKPEGWCRAYPAVTASETPTAWTVVHKVSKALANVLDIYAEENANGLFAKSGRLFPFLSWPYTREARSVGSASPVSFPCMHLAAGLCRPNCTRSSWPGPGSHSSGPARPL